ncbi:U32 family peptidase [Candidatus Gracilibacteria bacterium]|nr:U32 family peptidase [Candidatus Gracilibacteria bacterium]
MQKHRPAIVAPGGSHQKAVTAAKYGAEEVYMGVPFTSLRMRSNKLGDFVKLKKTVDEVHNLGSKVFLTMNIFPRNVDIKIFEATVEKVAEMGADAIIFSDPGTFHVLKKYMPDTPLHLSTQTTTLNYSAVQFWYDIGVKRVVLARELHIDEIKEIKEKVPGMELEVFVHGAMCMTYSGRCLLGDYMGGRPGNKGECNHACRFKYKVWLEEERRPGKFFQLDQGEDGTNFIMSSRDLCTIDRLEEIIPYIDAMKIEGRSKSEFYVGGMVSAYKHVRDALIDGTPIDPEIKNLVNVIPHREYRDGFLFHNIKEFPDRENNDHAREPETPQIEENQTSVSDNNEEEIKSNLARNSSITKTCAGPLFARNYFGQVLSESIEINGETYHKISPKEVIEPGMQLHYLTPNSYGLLTITKIINLQGKELEKGTCNTPNIYIKTDIDLQGEELLYIHPNNEEKSE